MSRLSLPIHSLTGNCLSFSKTYKTHNSSFPSSSSTEPFPLLSKTHTHSMGNRYRTNAWAEEQRWIDREGGRRKRGRKKREVSYEAVPRGLISHQQFFHTLHTVKVMSGHGKPVARQLKVNKFMAGVGPHTSRSSLFSQQCDRVQQHGQGWRVATAVINGRLQESWCLGLCVCQRDRKRYQSVFFSSQINGDSSI